MSPDLDQARRFLTLLDDGAECFTWQFATDDPERKKSYNGKDPLAAHPTLHLDDFNMPIRRNEAGAAVWVMVNEGDGGGRKAENVRRVRAVFCDGDGQVTLDQLLGTDLEPHIAVETSPGHLHGYWLVDGLSVEQFEGVQRRIAATFGSDAVVDPCRVMRVPGFIHQKNPTRPFQVRIVHERAGIPYKPQDILRTFPPLKANGAASDRPLPVSDGQKVEPATEELVAHVRDILPEIWNKTANTSGWSDTSQSEWDQSLANRLVAAEFDDATIARCLGAFRLKHDPADRKWRRPDYVALTIGKARSRQRDDGATERQPAHTSWPEPIDIIGAPELSGWPELTPDCLPVPLFQYVEAEAERLNVDPCPIAAHVLAACATSISDAWRIKPKRHDHWTQQARIWTAVVKDVGARGTEMIRTAFWPVRERDKELYDQWKREYAEWKRRQAERAKNKRKGEDLDDERDPEPKCKRLVTQDTTVEAASDLLAEGGDDAKLTLLCDELIAFIGGFQRYNPKSSAARALWLEGYDGGPQRVDRIKRGNIYVPNWSIVVAGNIQPRRLAGAAKDLIDDGLFQRFMTVHTRPADLGVDDDKPLSVAIGQDYRDLHTTLAQLAPPSGADRKPACAYADDDGQVERKHFMRLVERLQADPTLPTIIRETAPKWSGLLTRLTLIFHLVEIAEQARQGATLEPRDMCCVSGPTVTMGATFLRRIALPNLFRLGFETLPEEGAPVAHARWIAGHVLAHNLERVTASEIGRAYRPLRGKALDTEQAMAVLCDAGWASRAESRVDSPRWAINPAVHQMFAAAAEAERERRHRVMKVLSEKVVEL